MRCYKTGGLLSGHIFIFFIFLVLSAPGFGVDEYSFDMSAYEKSPFEFGGYAEIRWEHMGLDKDAVLYQLNFLDQAQPDTNNRYTGTFQLEGRYHKDQFSVYARFNPEAYTDDLGDDSGINTHEAYFSWQVNPGIVLDAGKKLVKWGKGYAWNPVGFVERPKDPNEPDLAREGFTIIAADWITSLSGDLQTIAITPVLLPVTDEFNHDFGGKDNNFAGKLYFLYKDTDLDLMFLSGGSRSSRYGFDFSRNISTNFEIHGEWVTINDYTRKLLDTSGNLRATRVDVRSWLTGLRYLTRNELTCIVEYFYNGAGFTEAQIRNFYQLVNDVPGQTDPDVALAKARAIAQAGYVKQTVMREYLFVRVSQKEPFDILYFTPAITAIINLDDHSYNLAPEFIYTGVTNLEFRIKANILKGNTYSEFGEKQNDAKLEMRVRYYF